MADFAGDLCGSRFEQADLLDVELDGHLGNVTVNGVDIGPLIEAELNRREPEDFRLIGCSYGSTAATPSVTWLFWPRASPTPCRCRAWRSR